MLRFRRQSYYHPVLPPQPGCNIGYHLDDAGSGSICCFVRSLLPGEENELFLLSCEHVLCNNLRARDPASGLPFDPDRTICQPGLNHLQAGAAVSAIAEVVRAGNVRFDGTPNRIDAAIARVRPAVGAVSTTVGLDLPITGISAPYAGLEVIKVGSATETQIGRLPDDFLVDATVDYDAETPDQTKRSARFRNVVRYQCRCADGDSGAPVLNAQTYELVGLHFAGFGDQGLFCPIETVFADLAISL